MSKLATPTRIGASFIRQFAIGLGLLAFLISSYADGSDANAIFAGFNSMKFDDDDDDGNAWIFSRSPTPGNAQANRQGGQNAQVRPVYSAYAMPTPQYFNADPFFQMNTDKMFFMNHPDPFYDEPSAFPGYNSGVFGADRFFYNLERPSTFNYDASEN
jgi:hypothetical protein